VRLPEIWITFLTQEDTLSIRLSLMSRLERSNSCFKRTSRDITSHTIERSVRGLLFFLPDPQVLERRKALVLHLNVILHETFSLRLICRWYIFSSRSPQTLSFKNTIISFDLAMTRVECCALCCISRSLNYLSLFQVRQFVTPLLRFITRSGDLTPVKCTLLLCHACCISPKQYIYSI